jgi:hypothetical protein
VLLEGFISLLNPRLFPFEGILNGTAEKIINPLNGKKATTHLPDLSFLLILTQINVTNKVTKSNPGSWED